MLTSPRVSVIICAYTEDRWEMLIEAIESVQKQILPAAEVLVVIDHNPGLYERLRGRDGGFIVLENREEKGLSGARNTGVAAARSDIVAFLDDDAIAAPDWLSRLSAHLDETTLGAGGAVLPIWESRKPRWFPDEFYWTIGCTYLGLPTTAAPIRNPMGGAMCVWREIFSEAGGFHGGLGRLGSRPLGCEETELSIRAHKHWPQRHFIYEPEARVYHHIPARRLRFSYFRSRCYSEGMSKALVVGLVGGSEGLASERAYTSRTLPRGVARGIGDALHGDISGLGRAGAILLGLMFTALGYLVGTLNRAAIRDARQAAAPLPVHPISK